MFMTYLCHLIELEMTFLSQTKTSITLQFGQKCPSSVHSFNVEYSSRQLTDQPHGCIFGELSPVNSNAKRQLLGRQNEADAEVFNAAVPQMAT